MSNKRKVVSIKNKKHDPFVPTSKGGVSRTNMRKKAKLKTVDEPFVSVEGSDFLPCGESSLREPAKEPTSGDHGLHPCNMSNKRKAVSVKNKKHDPSVPTSKVGAPRTNMRKKANPSQDLLLLRKLGKPLPDDGLAVPLLKHQVW